MWRWKYSSLFLDRNKNVATLNRWMEFQALLLDIWIFNGNALIKRLLKTISDITIFAMKFSYSFLTVVEYACKRYQYGADLHNECTTKFFFFKCICFYGNNAICTRTILFRVENVWSVFGLCCLSFYFSVLWYCVLFVVVLSLVSPMLPLALDYSLFFGFL